jgi:hypothetical protein
MFGHRLALKRVPVKDESGSVRTERLTARGLLASIMVSLVVLVVANWLAAVNPGLLVVVVTAAAAVLSVRHYRR